MLSRWLAFGMALAIAAGVRADDKKPKAPVEPRVFSVFPLGGKTGDTFEAVIRGVSLQGAQTVVFDDRAAEAKVVAIEPEPVAPGEQAPVTPVDRIRVAIKVDSAARPGTHGFRVAGPLGVSNEIPFRVVAGPVIDGKLARKGEVSEHWVDAKAGQTMSFEVYATHPGFDPSVTLLEPSGSWFDPKRMNRIAFNDEPLFFPGLSTDARLVHTFAKAGKYCLRVAAFSGQGGPDYNFQLLIRDGVTPAPSLHPKATPEWDERLFTRTLTPDWLAKLAARGGAKPDPAKTAAPEIYRGSTTISLPGVVEGRFTKPAETQTVTFKIEKPTDLAIEIETPEATMPMFNPIVRLLESGGREVATSVYTKLNNCGGYMMKMIQAKTTVSLQAPGEYTVQIRDITSDKFDKSFSYRVMIRPQIPHIGKIDLAEDRVNLEPGQTKPVTVNLEREEEFSGFMALSADGLPPGVTVVAGAENPIEQPPLMNGGKVERYISKTQKSVLLLVAAPDAPLSSMPATVRVFVRPVVDGHVGEPVAVKKVPLMVIARRPS